MKTDFVMMKDMLQKSNIQFKIETNTEQVVVGHEKRNYSMESGEKGQIDWPIHKNIEVKSLIVEGGYPGFFTTIKFDKYDRLVSMEAFE